MLVLPNMGLYAWNHTLDPYDSGQLAGNFARLDDHDHSPGKGKQIPTGGIKDGAITPPKLAAGAIGTGSLDFGAVTPDKIVGSAAEDLGLSQTGLVRRGSFALATAEARTNAAYGTLGTPDQVTGLVLPSDGLIFVLYHALWQESVAGAARAAIFLSGTQINSAQIDSAAAGQEASTNVTSGTAKNLPLVTTAAGLSSNPNTGAFSPTSNATESLPQAAGGVDPRIAGYSLQPYGGVCAIMAAAGTYDVSVRFKASGGATVTASKRHLWAWTMGF